MLCPYCGEDNRPEAAICARCRRLLPRGGSAPAARGGLGHRADPTAGGADQTAAGAAPGHGGDLAEDRTAPTPSAPNGDTAPLAESAPVAAPPRPRFVAPPAAAPGAAEVLADPYAPPRAPLSPGPLPPGQVPDRLALGIAATVISAMCCGCAPIGVVSLVYATTARTAVAQGQADVAWRNAELARKWAIATFVLSGVSLVATVAWIIVQVAIEVAG